MYKKIKLGWIPDDPDERDIVFSVSRPKAVNRIHDLRWAKIIPPVRDQGQVGSCTGFGTTGVAWAAMMADKTFTTPAFHPSELFAYYNGRKKKALDSGASIRDVVKGTIDYGLAPLASWPYDVNNVTRMPSQKAYEMAMKFKTIKYARVRQTESAIVTTIAGGFPIVFGHFCHSNFFTVREDGIVPMPSLGIEGGHCEIIIGYNMDSRLFIVQNSWGECRGARGYEYFPFDYILNGDYCMDFWVIYEVSI